MFWRQTATTQQTHIETLLGKSNVNVEELLDEDDLIQVFRSSMQHALSHVQ